MEDGTTGAFTARVMRLIALGSAPLYAWFFCYGEMVFAWIFGDSWRLAGTIAVWLTPVAWLSLFTSWPERIFEARGQQRIAFAIQLTFDGLSIAAIVAVFALTGDGMRAIQCFVAVQVAYHAAYFAAVAKLTALRLKDILKIFGLPFASAVLLGAIAVLMSKNATLGTATQAIMMGCLAGTLAVVALWTRWREYGPDSA